MQRRDLVRAAAVTTLAAALPRDGLEAARRVSTPPDPTADSATPMTRFLERFDAIVSPANVEPAVAHGAATERVYRGSPIRSATTPRGGPAGTVRVGTTAGGLPIGVQVTAAPWHEDVVLALLGLLEQRFGGWRPPDLAALSNRRP